MPTKDLVPFIFELLPKTKRFTTNDGGAVQASYQLVRLMLIFTLAVDVEWALLEPGASEPGPISYKDLKARYETDTPSLGLWEQFSGILLIAAAAVIAVTTQ